MDALEDKLEQIGAIMEKALQSIVLDLRCERDTVEQRLQDVRRRLDAMNRIHEEAKAIRLRAQS